MSVRRRPAQLTSAHETLAGLAGLRIPGGCDDCDAYQIVDRHGEAVFVMTVHHDPTCPWLASYQRETP